VVPGRQLNVNFSGGVHHLFLGFVSDSNDRRSLYKAGNRNASGFAEDTYWWMESLGMAKNKK
jgi:hypothetical protein